MRAAFALLLLAICTAPLVLSGRDLLARTSAGAPAVEYTCPMHPAFTQDHPGDCPICGMKLVPVKPHPPGRHMGPLGPTDRPAAAAPSAAGAIQIDTEKQRVLGIAVSAVRRSGGMRALRLSGRVATDEARLYKLNAGVAGSMRDVSAATTGSRVKKDQVLGSFYAPDTISVMQLFILNTQGYGRRTPQAFNPDGSPVGTGKGEDEADVGHKNSSLYNANIQQRVMQLENFGVSAMQREEIARAGRVPDTIKIVSPADGFVLARNVFPGLKFDRGFEFYRIADLRRVWVMADVFPQDAPHVRAGMRAEVSVPGQGVNLATTVTEILPQVDADSRTLKVKLALDNPGCVLRPDMFVDVSLSVDLPSALVVPSDAIVDSGLLKRVFVQTSDGLLEPRVVQTGWRSGDEVEIVKGLSLGELVVTAGTFFLDSETRMSPGPSGAAEPNAARPVPAGHPPRGDPGTPIEAGAGVGREQGLDAGGGAR
jgi:Cu(I)/Ag(I) efflux system membrane fusion protein